MMSKLLKIVMAVAIAFGLWVYVVTVVSPESQDTFYNIPVVFEGQSVLTERGLMITSGADTTVTLRLTGNRSDLRKVDSSNITVKVDLSKISEAGEQNVSYSISYPGGLTFSAQREPETITLRVEERISKDVPINVIYAGSIPEDFICDKQNATLNYNTVTIEGPSPVIDQITQAQILVDLSGRTESISETFHYTLCNADGEPVDAEEVTTNVQDVRLELRIQRVKEIPLKLSVVSGGGASADTCVIQQSHTSIRVSGSDAALAGFDEINLGTVNLGELLEDTQLVIPLTLPDNVTNISGVTSVTVTIQFPDLAIKTVTITEFMAMNVPEGLEAIFLTQELNVMVRGSEQYIEALTAEDVVVRVSFMDADVGTTTIRATIMIKPGFGDVGAVGNYSISATIREIEVPQIPDIPEVPEISEEMS